VEEQQSWSCICVYKYVRVIRLRERVAMVCEERAQQGEREQETGGATSGDVNDERARVAVIYVASAVVRAPVMALAWQCGVCREL
jgi:hypothetical protein